ncbi:MAG: hypothetical protein PHV32_11205 [Eubacteriales bacterium]|jgi:hypothetical protein|nr:hypothetical protein [Eubacteriales bacterium]
MQNNCWLPDLVEFNSYGGNWGKYEDAIYRVFKKDFIDSKPNFEGKQVNIRRQPMVNDKEEAFIHVTHQDYNKDGERLPDMRRCERIRWVRSFIEEYNCDSSKCIDCDGVKVWEEDAPRGTGKRVQLLLQEERYMVVLERRSTYCLLITAFYFEHDHALRKKLEHYENNK